MMSKHFNHSSIQGMAKSCWVLARCKSRFPRCWNCLRTLALTVPISSIDCELGFSKQNLIKTKISAKLATENVSTLKMSVDTPQIEVFDLHMAFVVWCSLKDHVICRTLSCRQTVYVNTPFSFIILVVFIIF